ncbi:hypothetical protein LCGC14_0548700 [marine sediment metagenome]|uniref:DNA 5'-3' helicase n=1 Tax=marine sediment metagenome TaxID=412755 RepID=A0A0F9RQP7_9ZZZZ
MADFHYNQRAEMTVIGSMLEDNKVIPLCIEKLTSQSFFFNPHQIVFDACTKLNHENKPIDPVTLSSTLEEGELNRIGGIDYLFDLQGRIPTTANIEHYIDLVLDSHIRRQLDIGAKQIIQLTQEGLSIDETLINSQELILTIGSDVMANEQLSISDQVNNAYEHLLKIEKGEYVEISTGYDKLDLLSDGFHRQEFAIVAGLSSVGKSAFMHNIIYDIAINNNCPVVLFCYESNHVQVIKRMVSAQSGVDIQANTKMAVSEDVMNILAKIKHSNLIIEDVCPRSVEYAVAHCRRLKLEYPDLTLAVFDHIHLMTADVGGYSNYEREVSKISATLKDLAKSLNIAVVGICQMSRASIRRADTRPMLDDLRASGSLEQDSDLVMFIYREDYYDSFTISPVSATELIVRKNRNGPIGTINFEYNRALSLFTETNI